jgi:hypothetical protein
MNALQEKPGIEIKKQDEGNMEEENVVQYKKEDYKKGEVVNGKKEYKEQDDTSMEKEDKEQEDSSSSSATRGPQLAPSEDPQASRAQQADGGMQETDAQGEEVRYPF